MAAHESKRKYERPGHVDLHQHYSKFRSRILPTLNLAKYYVEHPNSFIQDKLLKFNINNRLFSISTARGANYGSNSRYYNIHQRINVLGFDLSFKYRHDTKRTFDIWS